jgi:hypothetical protein
MIPRRQTLSILRGAATWELIALWQLIKATTLVRVYCLLIPEKHHGNVISDNRSGATAVA